MRAGMTLIEVTVALAVAALLVTGVMAATQSSVRTVEGQRADGRRQEGRARAFDVLREDWRGRIKLLQNPARPPQGTRELVLETTSDSLAGDRRSIRRVTYSASELGLVRKDSGGETPLLSGPVALEFWDGVAWRPEPAGALLAVRVSVQAPAESFVLR